LPDPTDGVEFQRGGFWRRALAVLIDVVAISVVLQIAALALFQPTRGRVQFSGGPIYVNNCRPLTSVPAELSFPRGVRRQYDHRLPAWPVWPALLAHPHRRPHHP
jgi:uncharacterized RDD family membrane protein YckC